MEHRNDSSFNRSHLGWGMKKSNRGALQNNFIIIWILLLISCTKSKIFLDPSDGKEMREEHQNSWVVLGRGSVNLARRITDAKECPKIEIDGVSKNMEVRAAPSPAFPMTVCEASFFRGAQKVKVGEQSLPILKKKIRKIAVFGDSGCRINGDRIQSCNNVNQWPFSKIAQSAAKWQPDLVIHVGDYFYRESPCPEERKDCEGSPYGDNWETWEKDFFLPASELLSTVPWIFVRGNHELCSRGGQGWSRLLSAYAFEDLCENKGQLPFGVDLGDVEAFVVDSASIEVPIDGENQFDKYLAQFKKIKSSAIKPVWLLLHQPIWTLGYQNEVLQKSYQSSQIVANLVISGHQHVFRSFVFHDGLPSQVIAGTGGTMLDPPIAAIFKSNYIGNRAIKESVENISFGFVGLVESSESEWEVQMYNQDGDLLRKFPLPSEK